MEVSKTNPACRSSLMDHLEITVVEWRGDESVGGVMYLVGDVSRFDQFPKGWHTSLDRI